MPPSDLLRRRCNLHEVQSIERLYVVVLPTFAEGWDIPWNCTNLTPSVLLPLSSSGWVKRWAHWTSPPRRYKHMKQVISVPTGSPRWHENRTIIGKGTFRTVFSVEPDALELLLRNCNRNHSHFQVQSQPRTGTVWTVPGTNRNWTELSWATQSLSVYIYICVYIYTYQLPRKNYPINSDKFKSGNGNRI